MKPAFGAVSMLLALLIVAIMFIMMVSIFKPTMSTNFGNSSVKQENVEERVDDLVKEIETRRLEAVEYYKNIPD